MYQMIDDEARHSICQKSRQCVEILEIQHNNQKVSVIVMSLWRCKEGCISEDRGQRIEFEFGRETTSSDPTKASWSQMLLATIDATVLISGLSLLILVAGPVGGGRRGKQRGIRHAVTGRRPREPRGDQGRRRRRRRRRRMGRARRRRRAGEDRPCSLQHRQLSSS